MAAENGRALGRTFGCQTRFNEAAAHGRGKRRLLRPRRPPARRFNEAAAHGRGKRLWRWAPNPAHGCFNEAAAHGRGKRRQHVHRAAPDAASMRPRRMAAENIHPGAVGEVPQPASMRPRRMAAENFGAVDFNHSG